MSAADEAIRRRKQPGTWTQVMRSGVVSCAHCWHYKVNAAGPTAKERCCFCGDWRDVNSGLTYHGHGPYA